MFCPNCGNKIKEGIKFCGNCGHKFNLTANTPKNPVIKQMDKSTFMNANCINDNTRKKSKLKKMSSKKKKIFIILAGSIFLVCVLTIVMFIIINSNNNHNQLVQRYQEKASLVKEKKGNLEQLISDCENLLKNITNDQLSDASLLDKLKQEISSAKTALSSIKLNSEVPDNDTEISTTINNLDEYLIKMDDSYNNLNSVKKNLEDNKSQKATEVQKRKEEEQKKLAILPIGKWIREDSEYTCTEEFFSNGTGISKTICHKRPEFNRTLHFTYKIWEDYPGMNYLDNNSVVISTNCPESPSNSYCWVFDKSKQIIVILGANANLKTDPRPAMSNESCIWRRS